VSLALHDAPAGYVVGEVVGEGGMGVVHRARRDGAPVALKLLRPELALERAAAERFVREAEAAGNLEHPSIVRVLERGVTATGRPFVAYEWLEGETFATRGPTSTRRAQLLVGQVLDALALAHRRGLLHRDLSPKNLFVHEERATVIDFGLVAHLERCVGPESWTRLTRTGFVVGTPPYIAPEQIEGERLSPRTDLWAVGVVLFWMTSGVEPFPAKTPTLRMLKITSAPCPVLSAHAPHVHPSFGAVVARALARDPAARWESAEKMRDALLAAAVDDVLPANATQPLAVTRTRRK